MSVRSAVGLTNNNSQLGEQISNQLASQIVVPASGLPEQGYICHITLDAGVWNVSGAVSCLANTGADFQGGGCFFFIQEVATNKVIAGCQATGTNAVSGEIFSNGSNIYVNMSGVVNITQQTEYEIYYNITYTSSSFAITTAGTGTGGTTILQATRIA